jgi:esterase/lipase
MEMHEFGDRQSPVILLLHAFGMHWSMWQGVIDGLKEDYLILVPSLEGHEDKERTVFTTVEHNAQSISNWLCENGYRNIHAVIGVSLGGSLTIKLLSLKTVAVSYAVIDAGIAPVGFNRVQEFLEVGSNLLMILAAHSLSLIRLAGLYDTYGQKQMEKFHKTIKTISWKTAKNAFYGVDTYTLPDSLPDVPTRIAYWYGSLEEKERKATAEYIKKLFPNVTVCRFEGYGHAQMCLGKPDLYVTEIRKTIGVQAPCSSRPE